MHHIRKEEDEKLTTADIAAEKARGPKLVDQNRSEEAYRPSNSAGELEKSRDTGGRQREALFADSELRDMRARWDGIQTGFVDEPRRAVKQADELVASAIKRIAEQFARERSLLEQQWDRGDNVSTEDLRQALRRYRGFFDRLLSV